MAFGLAASQQRFDDTPPPLQSKQIPICRLGVVMTVRFPMTTLLPCGSPLWPTSWSGSGPAPSEVSGEQRASLELAGFRALTRVGPESMSGARRLRRTIRVPPAGEQTEPRVYIRCPPTSARTRFLRQASRLCGRLRASKLAFDGPGQHGFDSRSRMLSFPR